MSRKKQVDAPPKAPRGRPYLTPEAQENHMISLAINLAEQQLRDGTASSQVITHYLKLGSTKEKLEKEILEKQKDLISAKTESLHAAKRIEELFENAREALTRYTGGGDQEDE